MARVKETIEDPSLDHGCLSIVAAAAFKAGQGMATEKFDLIVIEQALEDMWLQSGHRSLE